MHTLRLKDPGVRREHVNELTLRLSRLRDKRGDVPDRDGVGLVIVAGVDRDATSSSASGDRGGGEQCHGAPTGIPSGADPDRSCDRR